jgi:uncharacterized protein YegJ (DUF2314 family)
MGPKQCSAELCTNRSLALGYYPQATSEPEEMHRTVYGITFALLHIANLSILPALAGTSGGSIKMPSTKEFVRTGYDHELEDAAKEAKSSLLEFLSVWMKRAENGATDFSVKLPIEEGRLVENMWVSVDTIKNSQIVGKLQNTPKWLKQHKIGQPITAAIHKIDDWQFLHNGTVHGSFTTIVLMKRSIAQMNGLLPIGAPSAVAKQNAIKTWAELASKQRKDPSHPVALTPQQTETMSELAYIIPAVIHNNGRNLSPKELASQLGLPAEVMASMQEIARIQTARH